MLVSQKNCQLSNLISCHNFCLYSYKITSGGDDVSTSGFNDVSTSGVDDVSTSVLSLEIFCVNIAQEGALSGTDDFSGDDKALGFLNLFV